jgi:hypothetical protein
MIRPATTAASSDLQRRQQCQNSTHKVIVSKVCQHKFEVIVAKVRRQAQKIEKVNSL